MALVYVNGFDELSDPEPYWLDTTGTAFHAGTPGRFGAGKCLTYMLGGGNEHVEFPFENDGGVPLSPIGGPVNDAATVGFAFKFATGGYPTVIFRWYHWVGDARDLPAGWHETMRLGMDANNILYVASGETVQGRGTKPLLPLRYYYIEWSAATRWSVNTIGRGSWTAEILPVQSAANLVRVDGATELVIPAGYGMGSGSATDGSSQPYVDFLNVSKISYPSLTRLRYFYDNFRLTTWLDDLYVTNPTGTKNTGFLGDLTVQNMRVSASSAVPAARDKWALAGSGNPVSKGAAVREVEPDCDVSYVKSRQTGDAQTFTFEPVRSSPLFVAGFSLRAAMRKADIGARKVSFYANGWTSPGDRAQSPGDRYTVFTCPLDGDPARGGADWNEASLNSLEAGVVLVQ